MESIGTFVQIMISMMIRAILITIVHLYQHLLHREYRLRFLLLLPEQPRRNKEISGYLSFLQLTIRMNFVRPILSKLVQIHRSYQFTLLSCCMKICLFTTTDCQIRLIPVILASFSRMIFCQADKVLFDSFVRSTLYNVFYNCMQCEALIILGSSNEMGSAKGERVCDCKCDGYDRY